jgi:hypothetical protein
MKRIPEYFLSIIALEFYIVMSLLDEKNRFYLDRGKQSGQW